MSLRDQQFLQVLREARAGDRVKVDWGNVVTKHREIYPGEGVVVQVTRNAIYYRCPSGYACGVTRNHAACGVRVELRKRKAAGGV